MKSIVSIIILLTATILYGQQYRYWEQNSQFYARNFSTTLDGGFIVSGYATTQFGQNDYVISFVCYSDSSGQHHWEKLYTNFTDTFSFETVAQLPDSSFIVGGKQFNPMTNQLGGALLKLDSQGNEIWKKSISDSSGAEIVISDFFIDTDTSFFLVATKTGFSDGNLIMQMDTSGNILWQKSFEALGAEKIEFNAIKQAADKSIFITGTLISGSDQAGVLLRLDSLGNLLWIKKNAYSNSNFTDLLIDNDHLFCRNSTTNFGDVILSSFDYNGNALWSRKVWEVDVTSFPLDLSRRVLSFDLDSNIIAHCSNYSYGIFSRFSREGTHLDAFAGLGVSQGIEFYPSGSCALLMSGPAIGLKSLELYNRHFAVTRFESFNSLPNQCFWGYQIQHSQISDSTTSISVIPSSNYTVSTAMMENVSAFVSIDNSCVDFIGNVNEMVNNDFEISPNPSNDKVQLIINAGGELPSIGYLIDALGNEVMHFEIISSEKIVDVSGVKTGIYWMKIGEASKKLIIL
ncbi:MAG: T9SS type A sorting domain-containing protein [Crocinitomicaceae bacterium]